MLATSCCPRRARTRYTRLYDLFHGAPPCYDALLGRDVPVTHPPGTRSILSKAPGRQRGATNGPGERIAIRRRSLANDYGFHHYVSTASWAQCSVISSDLDYAHVMITLDTLDADAVCQTTRPRSSSMGGELHPGHRERLRCLSPCGDVVFPSRWIAGTPATSPPSRGDSPYPPGELSAPCWPIASASPAKATFHPVRFLTITSRLLSPVDMLTPQLTRPRPWRWQQTRPEGMLGEASLGSSSWDERPPLAAAAAGLFPSLNANLGHSRRDCTMVFHGAHT